MTVPLTLSAQCNDIIFIDGLEQPEAYDWPVAVTVSQLGSGAGRELAVTLNGGETLAINADGTFCFTTTTLGAQTYSVQVTEQPSAGNVCSLSNNTGTATEPVLVTAVCNTVPNLWDQLLWDQDSWN